MTPRKNARVPRALAPAPALASAGHAGARIPFDRREIKKLVALMEETGLLEIEIESRGDRVRLVRGDQQQRGQRAQPSRPRPGARDAADDDEREPATERAITSPMVGTFHRAPAPGQPPFVDVGDVVERGQVLCLIEAMKMMNEIEAEGRGRVKQILIENGRPVEYGEALFLIESL